jgi:hypothetical protein
MSTATTSLLTGSNSTDTLFRAWCQWIHDQLAAVGLVNTSDTGQINLATVTKPTGTSAAQGYEIWRFADSLQATYPVFFKIEYGSGAGAANAPGIWITMGTGSNGSGTLTGQVGTRNQIYCSEYVTAAVPCYMSGSTNRFVFAMWSGSASNNPFLYFGIERSKDSAGADNSEGIILQAFCFGGGAGFWFMAFLPFSGSIPAQETTGFALVPPSSTVSGSIGSDTYMYPYLPFNVYPRNPPMNLMAWLNSATNVDFSRETTYTLDVYGASHVYLVCGSNPSSGTLNNTRARSDVRIAIRYE